MNDNSRQILNKKNDKILPVILASKVQIKKEKVSILKINPDNTNQKHDLDSEEINCINAIQILLSELGFIFLMFLTLLLLYIIPEYHKEKIFSSKNLENFEFTEDPIIIFNFTLSSKLINK